MHVMGKFIIHCKQFLVNIESYDVAKDVVAIKYISVEFSNLLIIVTLQ